MAVSETNTGLYIKHSCLVMKYSLRRPKITFLKESNAMSDNIHADTVFVLRDKSYTHFCGKSTLPSAATKWWTWVWLCVWGCGYHGGDDENILIPPAPGSFYLSASNFPYFPLTLLLFSSFSHLSPGMLWLHREHSHH